MVEKRDFCALPESIILWYTIVYLCIYREVRKLVNKEKIILMCKAAAYESGKLRDDAYAKRYYKQDYIDLQRLKLRIWTTVFYLIYWVYYLVKEFYIEGANLLHYNYGALFIKVFFYYAILLIAVSWIAGFIHSIRFDIAKKRVDEYYDLLASINDFNVRRKKKK